MRRWTSATPYSPVAAALPPALDASPEPDVLLAGAEVSEFSDPSELCELSELEPPSLELADSEAAPPSAASLEPEDSCEEDSSADAEEPALPAVASSSAVLDARERSDSAAAALPRSARDPADRKRSLDVGAIAMSSCAACACTRVADDISEFSIARAAFSRCNSASCSSARPTPPLSFSSASCPATMP